MVLMVPMELMVLITRPTKEHLLRFTDTTPKVYEFPIQQVYMSAYQGGHVLKAGRYKKV